MGGFEIFQKFDIFKIGMSDEESMQKQMKRSSTEQKIEEMKNKMKLKVS